MDKNSIREHGSLHPNGDDDPGDGSGCIFFIIAAVVIILVIFGFVYGPELANWAR